MAKPGTCLFMGGGVTLYTTLTKSVQASFIRINHGYPRPRAEVVDRL